MIILSKSSESSIECGFKYSFHDCTTIRSKRLLLALKTAWAIVKYLPQSSPMKELNLLPRLCVTYLYYLNSINGQSF